MQLQMQQVATIQACIATVAHLSLVATKISLQLHIYTMVIGT